MAVPVTNNRNTIFAIAAGAVLVLVLVMLIISGGHQGQPSAQNGEGNPMQTNQGR